VTDESSNKALLLLGDMSLKRDFAYCYRCYRSVVWLTVCLRSRLCIVLKQQKISIIDTISYFYRAMHFSAKRGIAIACRLSVCLSARLSVRV